MYIVLCNVLLFLPLKYDSLLPRVYLRLSVVFDELQHK